MDNKFILDACCGGRLFWFDKKQPNTIYIDNRVEKKGHSLFRKNHSVDPDIKMDFRKLDFLDKSFKLVIFDPPHLFLGEGSQMKKFYGSLDKKSWRDDIKKGFDECWRCLDDYGVLVFKWNEGAIKKKEILEVIGKEPLVGHPIHSKIKTSWFVFMKIPDDTKVL